MSEDEARAFLASECQKAGGQRTWALAHCVSPSYVCDAIAGRRAIGAGLADALGLVRTLTFESKSERLYSCDCCGRLVARKQIANVIAYGTETAACDRCRGVEEAEL